MNQYMVQQGVQKLQGYNAGFNKAVSTFQEVLIVLLVAQIIQIFTQRLLYRDKPFAITLHDPISGEEVWSKGSEKKLEGKTRRIVKLVDNSAFTIALFISAFLVIQIYFPAYTWSVR